MCPDCGKQFYRKSDVNQMTPNGYIEFILTYPIGAFWAKADFDKLARRLDSLVNTYEFWAKYRKRKAELKIPSKSDFDA